MMLIEKLIYRIYSFGRNLWWQITGGRRLRIFGCNIKFTSNTELSESIWFHYPKKSVTQRTVMYTDFVQQHSLAACLDSLPERPVIVEIGAYHGQYAVFLGKMIQQKKGRLIAVEASGQNVQILFKNIKLNALENTVEIVQCFVQDKDGENIFILAHGSQSTIGQSADGKGEEIRSESIATLLNRLNIDKIDLLLIDIEGAEVKLLPAFPWSSVSVGHFYCEMHPGEWHRFGGDGSDIERVLKEQNLLCYDMYFQPFHRFQKKHYAGPSLLLKP